jgi:uncharacterized iron-regulated membrane protein
MPPIPEQVPVSVVDAPDVTPAPPSAGDGDRSRFWRTVWRTHFYAGVFAMPVLVMLALTGLVILYTDPINDLQFAELQRVEASGAPVSLDEQREAVQRAYSDWTIQSVIPPKDTTPTTFGVVDESGEVVLNVMVDPTTATVLGDQDPGAGIVGLANRLHGTLDNESVTVPLPTLPGLFGDGPVLSDLALGDVVVEIFACWALVLAVSGVYLWWPRKKGTGRALFIPRRGRIGRARWRDLHAVPGIALSVLLVFLVASGLPWSGFWGANWAYVAGEVTPNEENFWELDAPSSDVPEVGDLDRVGNRIPWATGAQDIPTSSGPVAMPGMEGMDHGDGADVEAGSDGAADAAAAGGVPAPISLDLVQQAAVEEGMLAGATITLPFGDESDPAAPVYGSFVVTNPWPSDISNQGALFIDQFSGETLGRSFASEWGELQWTTELGVQTHMGTQFGLGSRIAMTLACVLVLWAAFSGLVMFTKRRRGGTGFPRRPVDARLQRGMIVVAVLLALVYPLWGASALVVLVLDKYVIRKVAPLRRAFGMRDAQPGTS